MTASVASPFRSGLGSQAMEPPDLLPKTTGQHLSPPASHQHQPPPGSQLELLGFIHPAASAAGRARPEPCRSRSNSQILLSHAAELEDKPAVAGSSHETPLAPQAGGNSPGDTPRQEQKTLVVTQELCQRRGWGTGGGTSPGLPDEPRCLLRVARCQAAEVDGLLDDGKVLEERKGHLRVTVLPRHPAGKKPSHAHHRHGDRCGSRRGARLVSWLRGEAQPRWGAKRERCSGDRPTPPTCTLLRGPWGEKAGAQGIGGGDHSKGQLSGLGVPVTALNAPRAPVPGSCAVPRAGRAGRQVVAGGVRAAHVMAIGDPKVVVEA